MRWFWIDRFVEFHSGQRAVAVKCVSLAEPHVHDPLPGYPALPPTLIIEGIAQTGGILAGEYYDFHNRVVLAKIAKARFHGGARPGDLLRYEVTMENIQPDGAMCRARSFLGDQLQGEVDLYYAHLSDRSQTAPLFTKAGFLRMLRAFRLYDVALDKDGQPAQIPQHLLDAEKRDLGYDVGSPAADDSTVAGEPRDDSA